METKLKTLGTVDTVERSYLKKAKQKVLAQLRAFRLIGECICHL